MCVTRSSAMRAGRQVVDDENDGEPERYKFDRSLPLRYEDIHVLVLLILLITMLHRNDVYSMKLLRFDGKREREREREKRREEKRREEKRKL